MVKSQLSDYAKEKLQARLKEMGLDELKEFALDSPSGNARSEEADPLHWMRFVKMGIRAEVVRNDGSSVTGTILSGAAAREFIEEHDAKREDKRACLIVRRADDDYDIVPWAKAVDVRRPRGELINHAPGPCEPVIIPSDDPPILNTRFTLIQSMSYSLLLSPSSS